MCGSCPKCEGEPVRTQATGMANTLSRRNLQAGRAYYRQRIAPQPSDAWGAWCLGIIAESIESHDRQLTHATNLLLRAALRMK
jgi:hypothetical protein